MSLLVLTGASGSGKTAIADAIEAGERDSVDVFRFDRIGVPSPDMMVSGWGSCEAWQRAMTLKWFVEIARLRDTGRPVLFEGQMRLAFVREGLVSVNIDDARVVLVDCDDATRRNRLSKDRNQPDLATRTMMNWAAFLRREAQASGCRVLDTSTLPLDASVEYVRELLEESDAAKPAP